MSEALAMITGATSGIGRAAALRLAQGGYAILACGRDAERGRFVVEAVKDAGGHAHFLPFDVTSEEEWSGTAERVLADHGAPQVLVNCAGSFFTKPLPDTTLEEFRQLWRVDVESVVLGTKYGFRMMAEGSAIGSIINVSSLAGLIGLEDCAAYCAAKAAVTHFSRVAALEGAQMEPKVRVNSLNPGVIYTEMITGAYGDGDAVRDFVKDGNALDRVGTAEDIASAVAFLAGSASRMVTGSTLLVDGGRGAV
ncbi:SDR family NAD(P)-dependent oxidoreductase [Erythrobacter sp.]|uniref:SDR family NAD(P)-dependent oxidoreductase n=1 Tax=Erythrobacter sp. TaxID=1042 RepID=UPI002EB4804E|nr:SDR family oxidoreductase [Erythrobacter sp.]